MYPTIYDNPDNIFSFLVMTGYLKADALEEPEYGGDFVLCIPNQELASVYKKEISRTIIKYGIGFYKKELSIVKG